MLHLPQTNREELLDLNRGSLDDVRESLADIRLINTWLGGTRVACASVFSLLKKYGVKQATILDIGTGSADIPQRLVEQGKQRGIGLQVLALDCSARHLQVARERVGNAREISLIQGDAFHLPLRDRSVDIVLASLFLHHFRPEPMLQILREWERVSRIGWVANDLVRHPLPLAFFRATGPVFARSYITRHDGAASIRRAYTVPEMQKIVRREYPRAIVREHFPFRLSIVRDKSHE
jgi:ubiquinone/menaquinone biosynthesis C-methylase UbiE